MYNPLPTYKVKQLAPYDGTTCSLPGGSGQVPEYGQVGEVPSESAYSVIALPLLVLKWTSLQDSSQSHSCAFKKTEVNKSKPMTSPDVQHSTLEQSRQTRVCHKCGLQRHIRKFCPLKQQCYKCGGKGHCKLQCPIH